MEQRTFFIPLPQDASLRISYTKGQGRILRFAPQLFLLHQQVFTMEKHLTETEIAEKVFELSEQFNQYLFEHPDILDNIPDQAVLIFLDADDPAFNAANLELADKSPYPADSQRVFIRMQKQVRIVQEITWEADILTSPQPV